MSTEPEPNPPDESQPPGDVTEAYWRQVDEMTTLSDEAMTDLAVRLVLTLMASASTDKIRALDWWSRAKSALVTAAAAAESWGHMVSKMAEKLQIDVLRLASSRSISSIGRALKRSDEWVRFRTLCERDAVYIVAMAQVERDLQRESK